MKCSRPIREDESSVTWSVWWLAGVLPGVLVGPAKDGFGRVGQSASGNKRCHSVKGPMIVLIQLWNDDAGFVVSAELILISTICVLGLIVGLSEVQHSVVSELNDVADAIGELNQGFSFTGFSKKSHGKTAAVTYGSDFEDQRDDCDQNQSDLSCDSATNETRSSR